MRKKKLVFMTRLPHIERLVTHSLDNIPKEIILWRD